jgi:hypothetical protein
MDIRLTVHCFNIKQVVPNRTPAFMNTTTDSNTALTCTDILSNYARNRECAVNTDGYINALYTSFYYLFGSYV